MQSGVVIEPARVGDGQRLLALQIACYQSEAALYDDYRIAPLRQSLDELCAEIATATVLVARAGGGLVGSVRAHCTGRTCRIGRLIVDPACQRRGLGSRLMHAIEAACPRAERYELFTGHLSQGNLRLYDGLGYRECRREAVSERLTLVFLEKRRPPP